MKALKKAKPKFRYAKVVPKEFKLTTQAGRVGLLCGVIAKTVTDEELQHAIIADTEKRPYRKPVVAYGQRFNSITEAAEWALGGKQWSTLNELKAEQARIRNMCNADNVVGFYWSE